MGVRKLRLKLERDIFDNSFLWDGSKHENAIKSHAARASHVSPYRTMHRHDPHVPNV